MFCPFLESYSGVALCRAWGHKPDMGYATHWFRTMERYATPSMAPPNGSPLGGHPLLGGQEIARRPKAEPALLSESLAGHRCNVPAVLSTDAFVGAPFLATLERSTPAVLPG